jgi:hypothetical protein
MLDQGECRKRHSLAQIQKPPNGIMRKRLLPFSVAVIFLGFGVLAQAQCPEDPNDSGICDTLYAVCHDSVKGGPAPWEVQVSLLVTHDIVDSFIDSIAGFTIPIAFVHSNPATYCSLPDWKNNSNVYPHPTENSIFRHFGGMQNRMMSLSEEGNGAEWDTRIYDAWNQASPSKFFLVLIPTGSQDQRWWEGSRTLLATMTFLVEDTMTICFDTTFFLAGRYSFCRSDGVTYPPRDNMPHCISIRLSEHGDANGDGQINVSDALYMLNYLFRHGPPPVSFEAGDANCDGDHGALDVVYLLNYLFRGGPPPGCP